MNKPSVRTRISEKAKKRRTPISLSKRTEEEPTGKKIQQVKDTTRAKIGANTYTENRIPRGYIPSFAINFTPSAAACKLPQKPTTLGPLRLCTEAIIFRSNTE